MTLDELQKIIRALPVHASDTREMCSSSKFDERMHDIGILNFIELRKDHEGVWYATYKGAYPQDKNYPLNLPDIENRDALIALLRVLGRLA